MAGSAFSFAQATAIEKIDAHHYSANLRGDWCIGNGETSPQAMSISS